MKPNQEQRDFIKELLQSMLDVQETYDELYDHVLTALEAVPDYVPFNEAVRNIIEYDLGGKRGIRAIQARYIKIAIKDFANAYFLNLGQSLKSVLILLVVTGTIGYYFLIKNELVSPDRLVIFAILSIFPAGIARRRINNGYDWTASKTNYAMYYVGSYAMALFVNIPWGLWLLTSGICLRLQQNGIMVWLPGGGYSGMHINSTTVNIATAVLFFKSCYAFAFAYLLQAE
jgi:hypothetical protein